MRWRKRWNKSGKKGMKSKPFKVILDTNIWISYLISGSFEILDHLIEKGQVKFLFSGESLQEFLDVIQRPKLRKFFSRNDTRAILELFDTYGEYVEVRSKARLCRDPKDDFLVNLAIDGAANFLVTGDHDLLILGKVGSTKIIPPAELTSVLK